MCHFFIISFVYVSYVLPPLPSTLTVVGAHSPDEKMAIATVPDFTSWLFGSVASLSKVSAADFDKATKAV